MAIYLTTSSVSDNFSSPAVTSRAYAVYAGRPTAAGHGRQRGERDPMRPDGVGVLQSIPPSGGGADQVIPGPGYLRTCLLLVMPAH